MPQRPWLPVYQFNKAHKIANQHITMPRPTLTIDGEFFRKNFTKSKSQPTLYVAELSDIEYRSQVEERQPIDRTLDIDVIDYPTPGRILSFAFSRTDMNGDDIAGWNYKEKGGNRTILIIND